MAGKTSGRIVNTTNAQDITDLAAAIFRKHQADGESSFLKQLDGFDWDTTGPAIQAAADQNKLALELKRQMEEAFAKRDLMLEPIKAINDASRKLLKGKYAANPKKLGEWGFNVDDSPAKPRAKKSA